VFVGHLALGLAAKRSVPQVGLGWLIAAVVTADLLWPIFVLAGIETVRIQPGATAFTPFVFESYPWSHSLVMLTIWGLVLALLARLRGIDGKALPLLALLVVSHWLLDYITHAPDMPLWTGDSPRFGLALWNSVPATLLLEGSLWIAALVMYLRARPLEGWGPRLAFWSFVLVCTVMWAAGPWSPPPPDARSLGMFGLIGWITIPWAALADRRPSANR
jgi:membrane-bound metal-dependent hydrolase YbcI (DUF457 family)